MISQHDFQEMAKHYLISAGDRVASAVGSSRSARLLLGFLIMQFGCRENITTVNELPEGIEIVISTDNDINITHNETVDVFPGQLVDVRYSEGPGGYPLIVDIYSVNGGSDLRRIHVGGLSEVGSAFSFPVSEFETYGVSITGETGSLPMKRFKTE